MPQLTLEFTSNIIEKNDMPNLFEKCHAVLTAMLPTEIEHCKSRAMECNNFYIGEGYQTNAFIHLTLKVMPGRSAQTLENVAAALMQINKDHFIKSLEKLKLQITLELHELPNIYLKITS